jgi:long-chain fatty acid transport protein
MGGLGAAISDDMGSVHANPAGLSRAREISFTLGYQGTSYALSLQRAAAMPAESVPVDLARGTLIGATMPLPFTGVLRERITIGLGFYTPTDVIVRGRILRPDVPQYVLLADRTQTVAIQAGIGVLLPFGVRIGGGVMALAAIKGSVVISPDASGRVASRVDNQLITHYAPVLGASFERGIFRAGLVYRGTSVGRFSVTIEARDIGLPLPVFNIAGIAQFDPSQLSGDLGVVYRGWTLLAGITYKRWSEYPGPLEQTTMNSPSPPLAMYVDTVVPRVGVEHLWKLRAHTMSFRGGYFFEQSPLSFDPTLSTMRTAGANYFDNHRHAVTLGGAVAVRWRGTLSTFDLFAQLHVLAPRAMTDGTIPEATAPTWTTGGTVFTAGTTMTVTF